MNSWKALMVAVIAFTGIGYVTTASIGNTLAPESSGAHGSQTPDSHGQNEPGHDSSTEPGGRDNAGDKLEKAAPGKADDHGESEARRASGKEPADHDKDGDKHEKENSQDSGAVVLTEAQIKLAEITTTTASVGRVPTELNFTGEISLNQDRTTQIIPRLTGVVTAVHANLGDRVEKGSVMAVIDSRELAVIRAAYLTARERTKLAQTKFNRENTLWTKK